jgi:hypothetical protein
MAITEELRHDLYEKLIELLGRERAATLMEHLPPVGWADVATKRDLDHQAVLLRRDLDAFRAEMQGDSASLRAEMQTEFANVRAEMQTEFANVRAEMQAGLAEVRAEMQTGLAEVRAEIAAVEIRFERALREQSRTFFLGMLSANATLAGLAFAAAQIL